MYIKDHATKYLTINKFHDVQMSGQRRRTDCLLIMVAEGRNASVSKRLEGMRRNPAGDWTIRDVEAVCREFGVICEASRSGSSHYKVAHSRMVEKLTIPYKRPIKPLYIRKLVAFIDAVRKSQ
jgi:hypothetical protein